MRPAPLAFALAPVKQAYLLQARQMQALSFSVHIPLVCFGIALPAIILYAEWRYLRTGDRFIPIGFVVAAPGEVAERGYADVEETR
jgi:hypothetical protein